MKRKKPSIRTLPRGLDITPEFKRYTEAHKDRFKQLFSNNQYLLVLHDKSLVGQLKEFRDKGIKMSKACYYTILHGTFCSTNYALPYLLEEYWGISSKILLYEDLKTKTELSDISKSLSSSPFG